MRQRIQPAGLVPCECCGKPTDHRVDCDPLCLDCAAKRLEGDLDEIDTSRAILQGFVRMMVRDGRLHPDDLVAAVTEEVGVITAARRYEGDDFDLASTFDALAGRRAVVNALREIA